MTVWVNTRQSKVSGNQLAEVVGLTKDGGKMSVQVKLHGTDETLTVPVRDIVGIEIKAGNLELDILFKPISCQWSERQSLEGL